MFLHLLAPLVPGVLEKSNHFAHFQNKLFLGPECLAMV